MNDALMYFLKVTIKIINILWAMTSLVILMTSCFHVNTWCNIFVCEYCEWLIMICVVQSCHQSLREWDRVWKQQPRAEKCWRKLELTLRQKAVRLFLLLQVGWVRYMLILHQEVWLAFRMWLIQPVQINLRRVVDGWVQTLDQEDRKSLAMPCV